MEEPIFNRAAAEDVLIFWFDELEKNQWFEKDDDLDAAIRARFGQRYEAAAAAPPEPPFRAMNFMLAAVILLDQFPRNMFRGSAKAFATDPAALKIAAQGIEIGLDLAFSRVQRHFLYMPYQHSEDPAAQQRSVELYATLGDDNGLEYARRHKEVIDRFGRFPHRNELLGRASTPEEQAFLEQEGRGF